MEKIEGEKNVSLSQTSFKTSDIEKFKTAFPNKDVDLENLSSKPPPNFDMDALISAINASTFLKTAQNMTLASCLKHYEKIISGAYQDFCRSPPQKETWERLYSAEELNNLFTRPEEIEI